MSYQKQLIQAALRGKRKENESIKIEQAKGAIIKSDLKDIKGIGEATLAKLNEVGIKSKEQLKALGEEGLNKIKLNPLSLKSILNFLK